MNANTLMRAALVAGLTAGVGAVALAAGETAAEDYPVPGHGQLRLQVPVDWQVQYVYTEDASIPPTLHVFPLDGEEFNMTVTVYWHDGMDRNITSAESLRERVEQAGEEILESSTDQDLKVSPIEGVETPGYFYDLHDADAPADEFHYLTQGALAVGEFVLAFTIVTDERPSVHREECLKFLRDARQVATYRGVRAEQVDTPPLPL